MSSFSENDEEDRQIRQDPRSIGAMRVPLVTVEHMDTPREDAAGLWELYDKFPILMDPHLEYTFFENKGEALAMGKRFRHSLNLMTGAGKPNQTIWEWAEADLAANILETKLRKSINGFGVKEAGTATVNQNQRVEEIHRNVRKHRFLPW